MRTTVISKDDQLRALASSARQEIVDVLSRMGTASIAEIAAALGRPADALYYHLRELVRVRLVVRSVRKRGGREEALFRTVAPMLELRYGSPLTPRIISSMLRLGARDFRRAFASGAVSTAGPRRELWALRTTGWLTPGDVAGVNRGMRALRDAVSRPRRPGRLYAITIVLTPLDRSRRTR
jgi:DNA-binding transcriptional ArsR family regulator